MKKAKGFTLVEILVASAIAMLMLATIYLSIQSAQRSSTGIERKVTAQHDARSALEIMAMEIRMASYNPMFAIGLWRRFDDCGALSPNQIYRGIQEATVNSLTVEMDICCSGGDGDGDVADPNEIIRYSYETSGNDRYITRSTNCGAAQPFLGDSAAASTPRTVRVINADLGIPLFRYYDGAGAEIPAANLPARIPEIRIVDITLAVETDEIDPSTGQRRRMVYSTRVIPRNHAIQ